MSNSLKKAYSSLAVTTAPTDFPTVAMYKFQLEPDGLAILWYTGAYTGWSGRCISPHILTSAPTMTAIVNNEIAIVLGATTQYWVAPGAGSNYWIQFAAGGSYPP